MKSKIIKITKIIHHPEDQVEIKTNAKRSYYIPKDMLIVIPEVGDELVLKWNDKVEYIEIWYKDNKLITSG